MDSMYLFLPILGVMVVMMFLSSRKQKKEQKAYAAMLDELQVGDEVTMTCGMIGRIVSIKDETVLIETGRDRVKIRFLRSSVQRVDVKAEDT